MQKHPTWMISKASWASSFSVSFPESLHCNNSCASGQQSEKITVAAHHLYSCSSNPTHPANLSWSINKLPQSLAGFALHWTNTSHIWYRVTIILTKSGLYEFIKSNILFKVRFCMCKEFRLRSVFYVCVWFWPPSPSQWIPCFWLQIFQIIFRWSVVTSCK